MNTFENWCQRANPGTLVVIVVFLAIVAIVGGTIFATIQYHNLLHPY